MASRSGEESTITKATSTSARSSTLEINLEMWESTHQQGVLTAFGELLKRFKHMDKVRLYDIDLMDFEVALHSVRSDLYFIVSRDGCLLILSRCK